jgi:hypothetical protein
VQQLVYVKPALRPLKAVSSSPTRATASPTWQFGNDVGGDSICSERDARWILPFQQAKRPTDGPGKLVLGWRGLIFS